MFVKIFRQIKGLVKMSTWFCVYVCTCRYMHLFLFLRAFTPLAFKLTSFSTCVFVFVCVRYMHVFVCMF